ncbi:hypothetical protein MRX96_022655 [Rhipicephalus microplus]
MKQEVQLESAKPGGMISLVQVLDGEQSWLELFLCLHGIGLSLMSQSLAELAYLSVHSAPAQWEVRIHDAWKPFTLELATWLEYRWASHTTRVAELKDYVQVRKFCCL